MPNPPLPPGKAPPNAAPNGVLIYGKLLSPGEFLDNPTDWSSTDDGTGLLTGTLRRAVCVNRGFAIPPGALMTRGDTHPFDPRLRYKDHSIAYGANELAIVSFNFVGLAEDPGGVTWDWNGPTDETPIDMHPDFTSWGTIYGETPPTSQDNPAQPPDDSKVYSDKWGTVNWNHANVEVDSNQRFVAFRTVKEMKVLDLPGVKAYKTPRATLRVNFSTAKVGNFSKYAAQLGRWYDKIPIADIEREIPTAVSPKSWLLTSLSVSAFAGIYKIQLEFALSGEKGWNRLIYRKGGVASGGDSGLSPPGGWPSKL